MQIQPIGLKMLLVRQRQLVDRHIVCDVALSRIDERVTSPPMAGIGPSPTGLVSSGKLWRRRCIVEHKHAVGVGDRMFDPLTSLQRHRHTSTRVRVRSKI